jgi:hypothetical protein
MNPPTDAPAPRLQFGIANILAFTTLIGLLTTLVSWLTFYPINLYLIGMFVSVLASQSLLFRGKRPRSASVLAGVLFTLILAVYLTVDFNLKFGYHYSFKRLEPDVYQCAHFAFWGGVLGYVLGAVISGVFAIARKMQRPVKDASASEADGELS